MRYGDEWLPEPIATEEADKAVRLNDIAATTVESSRQLLSRAKRKLDKDKQIGRLGIRISVPSNTIINHQPAFLYYRNGNLFLCQIFGFSPEGKIAQISNVLDPQKLKGLNM